MRIFSDLELVERSGYGVPKIINIYGKDVFEVTDNFIRVVLPFDVDVMNVINSEKVADKAEKVADKTEKVADKSEKVADKTEKVADKSEKVADKSEKVADKTEKVADKAEKVADKAEKVADKTEKVADKLNRSQELILDLIKNSPYITIHEIMKKLNLSDFGVRKSLKFLKDNNIISRMGSRKSGYWIVHKENI